MEWDDHSKVRRATAHAPDDEVPPPPRGGDDLRLAAHIPHAPEAAWEALHYALYWAQRAPEGPLPPEHTPAWTRHATRYTAHMRRHGAGTGHRLLTWPTDPPDALQETEEVLGPITKQVFQLKDPVPTSKPDVPAAREHPVFAPGHAPDDEVPPPPRGGDHLRLAARIPHAPEAAWEALHYALYWAQGAPEGPLPPERTPAWTRHATSYTAHMRRHVAGTGHRLLTWPTDPPDSLQEAEEVLGPMTKQVFQLKDPVPTSKPDVPAAREHPVFAPGHAPVQHPQGAPPQRGQPAARRRQGAQKRKAPAQAKPPPKPRAKSKSWTKEEAAALYPEYAIRTRVQLPFEYATAAGPSKWIWAAGEVKHRYLVTRDHQGFKIHVKWDPATPNNKKVGRTIELWRDRTGREMVPMQLCTPDTEHLTGTEYTGEVHNAWPLAQLHKRNCKAPAAQGVIDLLDA